jgi:Uma2 family endonuclease
METTREQTAYEQERGKPMPSFNHGFVQAMITGVLLDQQDDLMVVNELTLQLGDDRVTPDVCVYPHRTVNFQDDVVAMTEMPLLAVEILSPTQGVQEVVTQIQNLLEAGVESCWLVQPATETVTIYRSGEKPRTFSTGTFTDPATGIEADIADIFPDE